MKKLYAILLLAAVVILSTACNDTTAAEAPSTQPQTEAITEIPSTTVKPTEETVREKKKATEAASEKKKKKVKKTEPTTFPPTQGVVKPNRHINIVYPPKGSFSASDLVFKYKGKTINLNDTIESVIKKFGEDYALGEDSDTEFEYEYDGFTVGTYKKGEVEKVVYINVFEDNVATAKGVKIGMYASRLKRYYGDAKKFTDTEYVYGSGSKTLTFNYENNIITEYTYNYKR